MTGPKSNWNPKPADKIIRHPRQEEIGPVHIGLTPPRTTSPILNPSLILMYAFAILIGIGTILLSLPIAHTGDGFPPFIDALFTATSAVTVTGLITQDTPTYWSLFGQFVILILMFTGGLGIMTIVGSVFVLAGQKLPLSQRMVMRETIGTAAFTNIARTTVRIVLWTTIIQIIGSVLLWARFTQLNIPQAIWHGLFQSISSFNNAGFTSIPGSANMSAYGTDAVVLGSMGTLILLGSLSYWVLADMARKRAFSRLNLNSKLVLLVSGMLLVTGMLVFFIFETQNPNTLEGSPTQQKLLTSLFHSVNRTAGFSTIDFDTTTDQTNFAYMALMFIGGASASVAGGIKVNTFALIILSTFASLKGTNNISIFSRTIPNHQIRWAHVLVLLSIFAVFWFAFVLVFIEPNISFLDLLFESVSAFGTVGLSTGLTGQLNTASKLLLIIAMFVGRVVPPMVIVVAFSRMEEAHPIRHPKERVSLG